MTHGTAGDGDDIMRMRLGEQALADAGPAIREVAARMRFQDKALLDIPDEVDDSLEVDPLEPNPIAEALDDSLTADIEEEPDYFDFLELGDVMGRET